MVDNTDYASQKIKDFKYAYKVALNPFTNKAIDEIIDAMFENVGCYYEQFKDSISRVPTSIETYRYHLINPQVGTNIKSNNRDEQYYPLLDFLINRAISNLDGIELTTEESSYKNRRLAFNTSKYRDYERYDNVELLASAKRKTLLKETGKVLCSYDFTADKTLHTSLDCSRPNGFTPTKKLGSFIGCLRANYPEMLTVDQVINAIKNNDCNDIGTVPFNSEVLALTAHEYYSTKFANMFDRENVQFYKPLVSAILPGEKSKRMIVLTPNSLSRFAGGGRFFYHMENLVGKPAMFSSMFFGREDAIKEFACNYKAQIDKVWDDFYKKPNDNTELRTDAKFKAILINACDMTKTDDEQKNTQRYVSQSALDLIFLKAYTQAYENNKISKARFTEICREAGLISPSIHDEYKDEISSSRAKGIYDKMYTRLMAERSEEKQKAAVTKLEADKPKATTTAIETDKPKTVNAKIVDDDEQVI